ncbi:DUF378 domain-containing protein [Methanococcus voltae]|uniref:DUF378 domain-containing protein n=1 Tax=Methanococcus voltae (strain ATCC BAA-1334 / A3) TaxID=456320 RepID=D7DUN7_METV3|nr:DUF378 domain-containing protein [Methanococcus voltae]MCS3900649.1 uncharacterized membrane protein YuzA (DUF378 family) [Methanococcus voltae]
MEMEVESKMRNMAHHKTWVDKLAIFLVIIGGLNWGLVGALNIDLVQIISMGNSMIARLVYILVGLSALYMIYYAYKTSE